MSEIIKQCKCGSELFYTEILTSPNSFQSVYKCSKCGNRIGILSSGEMEHDIALLKAENEELHDKLTQIDNWCRAYPLSVFPEPDMKEVRMALEAVGITIDSVAASIMRRLLNGIQEIVSGGVK